tara:strand:- start:66 stop:791 length:726 start_codon:yes stop_codon:yes gene_type:complete
MKIQDLHSPNFNNKKRSIKAIKAIVIHYTGMQSGRESILRLTNKRSKVSSHFVIGLEGKVLRLVKDSYVAWHAGKSCWGKYRNLNKNSIGIELVNKGHRFGYTNFKKKQLFSLIEICKHLIRKYRIINKNIVGHSDIAPLRKIDPGEKFPWELLAKNKIGIWHDYNFLFLIKFRKIKISKKNDKLKFIKHLRKIGYCFSAKKESHTVKVIKAFQRHYRKELINGIIDKECLLIAENLSKKL